MAAEQGPYRFDRVDDMFEHIHDPFFLRTFGEVFNSGKFKWNGVSQGDLSETFLAMRFVVIKDGKLKSTLFSLTRDDSLRIFTDNELSSHEASMSGDFMRSLTEKLQREGLQTAAAMVISRSKSGELGTSVAHPELLDEFYIPSDVSRDESSSALAFGLMKVAPLKPENCTFPSLINSDCIKRGLISSKRLVTDWDRNIVPAPISRSESFRNSWIGQLIPGGR